MHSATLLSAVVGLSASAAAHMVMNQPVPLNPSTISTSPLNGEDSFFPCQGGEAGSYDGDTNTFQAGGQQTLGFTGSAVHGGGSCQISLTYENPPPADKSKWKVIHTIMGGCPSNAAGNLVTSGSDANGRPDGAECTPGESGECKNVFEFPVPADLPNGQVFVAWTWFNKIGNREMYMNCAAAEITGGSDDTSFLDSLPEMFVANIPGECTTNEGVLEIPNPGESVERHEDSNPDSIGTCGSAGSGGSSGGGVTPPSNDSGSGDTPVADEPETPEAPAGPDVPDGSNDFNQGFNGPNRGGNFIPIDGNDGVEAAPTNPNPVAPVNPPINEAPVNSPSAGSGQCPQGFISCTEPGQVVCDGTTNFGICDLDNCAKVMPLANGSVCENGVVARKVKRSSVRGSSSANHGRLHHQHRRRIAEVGS